MFDSKTVFVGYCWTVARLEALFVISAISKWIIPDESNLLYEIYYCLKCRAICGWNWRSRKGCLSQNTNASLKLQKLSYHFSVTITIILNFEQNWKARAFFMSPSRCRISQYCYWIAFGGCITTLAGAAHVLDTCIAHLRISDNWRTISCKHQLWLRHLLFPDISVILWKRFVVTFFEFLPEWG